MAQPLFASEPIRDGAEYVGAILIQGGPEGRTLHNLGSLTQGYETPVERRPQFIASTG